MTESNPNFDSRSDPIAPNEGVLLQEKLQHVSWGAIFLGLVIAIAFQILLGLFGIGIGLAILDPSDPMGGAGTWGIVTLVYFVIVQIISLFIGGYVAARLIRARTAQTAMLHGASIWALSLIAMVWLGTTTAGLAMSGLSGAVSGVASATGQAMKAVIPDDMGSIDLPEANYLLLPEPIRQKLRENDISANRLQQEVRGAYRQVVTRQQQQELREELRQTAMNILRNPTDALEEIDKAIDDVVGEGAILSQEDLSEMEDILQRRLNLSDQEIQQITDQLQQVAQEARQNLKQALRDARQQALEMADAVTDQIAKIAFWMFIASVLGLIAAVFGGKKGEIGTYHDR